MEEIKYNLKKKLSIELDYPLLEIVEALVLNDHKKLDLIRQRIQQLQSEYKYTEEILDGNNEEKINSIFANFVRPKK